MPSESNPGSDRNLLYGMIALQAGLVTKNALLEAMQAWVLDKDRPLGDILVEKGGLNSEAKTLLDSLVEMQVARHNGDVEASLAEVSSVPTSAVELLAEVEDSEVQNMLASFKVPKANPDLSAGGAATLIVASAGGAATDIVASAGGMRYQILRPHAKGGLGQVLVARDTELQREVALKEILDHAASNEEARSRFLLEAEVTGKLEHPGIVPVYGLGTYADGRPYYAMKFIRGQSLKEATEEYHSQKGQTSAERNTAFRSLIGRFVDLCNTIAYAHSRGVLHRDLKPGNVMLGKYGETLVVDWGIAKVEGRKDTAGASTLEDERKINVTSGSNATPTQTGRAVGTPAFMSPEQAAGRHDLLGPASDIYGLGATLYYVLTGKPPVQGDNIAEVLRNVEQGRIEPPSAIKSGIAPDLSAISMKALTNEPKDRYSSAEDIAADLERWLADEPVSVRRPSVLERAGRLLKRHRASVLVGTSALLLLSVGALTAIVAITNYASSEAAARSEAQAAELVAVENEKAARKAEREAERAAIEERKAKDVAVVAKNNIQREKRKLEKVLYREQINGARQAWEAGDV
ncbi:serine/threonine-protein kinase, partial [Stratiformator vulcanicus]|uniref:serine/threonine-protein kinase n=1 Tax=Stratiformator vulcanicus TaxID=2527980 RepID=UPI0011A57187